MNKPLGDGKQIQLGSIPIKIDVVTGGLEKVQARVLRVELPPPTPQNFDKTADITRISLSQAHSAPRFPLDPKLSRVAKRPNSKIATKQLEIKITLPDLASHPLYVKIKSKLRKIPRNIVIAAGILLFIAISALGNHILNKPPSVVATKAGSAGVAPKLERGTPSYATTVPSGKNIQDLGGWTRVSPPGRNPVYAYVDKIGTVQITVSEQPLPANFKSDTAHQIDQLAQNFSANEKLSVGDITVHIGTSATGPQSVIFSKGNLLILIKSESSVANDQWVAYVSSLQ